MSELEYVQYSNKLDNINLTKDFILSNFFQEDIVSFYTGIPVMLIKSCVDKKNKISNPLRNDINPSLGFYYKSNNKLHIKDFAGYFSGDVFDLVGEILCKNSNDKEDFKEILKDIWYNMANQVIGTDFNRIKHNIQKAKNVIESMFYDSRKLNENDYKYWSRFQINRKGLSEFLERNMIIPVSIAAYKGKVIYNYYKQEENDVCYAYIEGILNGVRIIQLYRPNADRIYKFRTNYNLIKGLTFFKRRKYLLITKARKDMTLIMEYLRISNIQDVTVIALPSENYKLSKKEYDILSKDFESTFTLFDYDYTGIKQSNYCKRKFGTTPLFFKQYKTNKKLKDFANLCELYHYKQIIKFIINVYAKLCQTQK
jgi:hypothetical protein